MWAWGEPHICHYHRSFLSSMGMCWWMEAPLTLILISPCIFIMAPRVTPARCMKCPASCHPRPLPLCLCNVFLLPSLPPSLSAILSPPLTSTYLDPSGVPLLSHINVIYFWYQEATVCFFPSLNLSCSQSVCSCSSFLLSASLFSCVWNHLLINSLTVPYIVCIIKWTVWPNKIWQAGAPSITYRSTAL